VAQGIWLAAAHITEMQYGHSEPDQKLCTYQRRWRGHGARKPDPGGCQGLSEAEGSCSGDTSTYQSQCPIEGQFTVEGKGLATDIKRALV